MNLVKLRPVSKFWLILLGHANDDPVNLVVRQEYLVVEINLL